MLSSGSTASVAGATRAVPNAPNIPDRRLMGAAYAASESSASGGGGGGGVGGGGNIIGDEGGGGGSGRRKSRSPMKFLKGTVKLRSKRKSSAAATGDASQSDQAFAHAGSPVPPPPPLPPGIPSAIPAAAPVQVAEAVPVPISVVGTKYEVAMAHGQQKIRDDDAAMAQALQVRGLGLGLVLR